MSEAERITALIAKYSLDPLGYAHVAFPWGQGSLAGVSGPRKWQGDVLKTIGTHLQNPETRYQPLRIAIASGHGIGKAQPQSLMFHTPEGLRRWGDLAPGDRVFGRKGETVVLAVHQRGVLPVYRVTFDDGSSTRVCGDHLWTVKGRNDRRTGGDWQTLSTEQIIKAGVTRSNGVSRAKQWQLPSYEPVEFARPDALMVQPYTLGVWLGDGGRNSGRITSNDPEVIARLREIGENVNQGTCMAWGIIGLEAKLRALGVVSRYSYQKSVPTQYMESSAFVRAEVLRGLLDTDGECGKAGTVVFSSCSRALAEDVIWLGRSLGGKARMQPTVKMPTYPGPSGELLEGRPCYRVTLTMPTGFRSFYITRKQDRVRNVEARYLSRWIASIEREGEEDCSCITVAAADSLYLTNDFIVTHNSALIGMIAAWGFDTMIDTRLVITANTEQQVVTKTSPEVAKWRKMALTADWAKVATMKHSSAHAGHEDSWRLDFVTWSENNTEAFAGLHNLGKRIIVIYDEAAGIVDKVWEVTEGALTDENTQIIWIAFGNPTKNTGRFREAFARHRHLWKTRQIDSRTVEGTNTEYLQSIVDTYGADSDIAKVRVLGQFPSASSMQFIGTALVEAAMDREMNYGAILPSDPVIFGLDHARFGDDSTVLAIRQGRDARSRPWKRWVGANSMEIAGDVNMAIRQYRPDAVFIDAGGQNAGGVIDRLRQLNPQDEHGAVPIFEINFGSRTKGMTARGQGDQRVKVVNKRAQMWQNMKAWLDRAVLPEWDDQADSFGQRIRDDLVGPMYSYDHEQAILLEKKEHMKGPGRNLPSPDYGDALALTFAEDVAPREIPEYLNSDNYGSRTAVPDRQDELEQMREGRVDYDRYDELR